MEISDSSSQALHRFPLAQFSLWDLKRSTWCWGSPGSSRTSPPSCAHYCSARTLQVTQIQTVSLLEQSHLSQAGVSISVQEHVKNPSCCMQNHLKYSSLAKTWVPTLSWQGCHYQPVLPFLPLDYLHPFACASTPLVCFSTIMIIFTGLFCQ